MRATKLRPMLNLGALIISLVINGLANLLPLNGQTTGEISAQFPLLITPPGYVFSIWGLIYTGLVAFVIYQLMPSQRENPRLQRIGWLFALGALCNSLWIIFWHYNFYAVTLIFMLGLLASLILIVRRLGERPARNRLEWAVVDLPFSIYLGWISVATLVNTTVVLTVLGIDVQGWPAELWTTVLIAAGASLAVLLGWLRRDWAFALVIAWAFSGIAQARTDAAIVGPVAWIGTALALGIALIAIFRTVGNNNPRQQQV